MKAPHKMLFIYTERQILKVLLESNKFVTQLLKNPFSLLVVAHKPF